MPFVNANNPNGNLSGSTLTRSRACSTPKEAAAAILQSIAGTPRPSAKRSDEGMALINKHSGAHQRQLMLPVSWTVANFFLKGSSDFIGISEAGRIFLTVPTWPAVEEIGKRHRFSWRSANLAFQKWPKSA